MDRRHHRPRRRAAAAGLSRRRRRPAPPAAALGLAGLCILAAGAGCHHKVIQHGRLDAVAVQRTAERISRVRGLAFLQPVRVRLAGRGEIERLARSEAGKRQSARERHRAQAWSLLGLLPRPGALAAGTEALIRQAPVGAYLPRVERLEIYDRAFVKSEVVELLSLLLGRDLTFGEVVAHELVHALQHQHFGLQAPVLRPHNSDAALAHAALVEGDAFLAGFELGLGALLAEPESFLQFASQHAPDPGPAVPAVLRRRFRFPYLAGAPFVQALRGDDEDWAAIDAAHHRPPRSTEQVLHPDKYLCGDDPPRLPRLDAVDAAMAAEPAAGFAPLWQDTLGELGLRALLAEQDAAERRAAGWGGDRLGLYRAGAGGGLALVWIVDFDRPADAADFFDGLERERDARWGAPQAAGPGWARWLGSERRRHLEWHGRRVVLLDAPAAAHLYRPLLAAQRAPAPVWPPAPTAAPAAAPEDGEDALIGDGAEDGDGEDGDGAVIGDGAAQPEALPPAEAVRIEQPAAAAAPRGPAVRLGSDSLGLTLGALLQVRGVRGIGRLDEGLALHGARLYASARATQGLDLGLELQLALEREQPLRDAFIRLAPVSPHLLYIGHFLIGRMPVPASRWRLRQRWALPLHQRPQSALVWAPDRRVGFAYDVDLARHGLPLRLRAGGFDGWPEGSGRGPLLAARLDLDPGAWLGGRWSAQLGGAVFWDRDREREADGVSVAHRGWLLDGRLGWGPVWLEGEVGWHDRAPGGGHERFGWALTAGAELLPDFLEAVLRYEVLAAPAPPAGTAAAEADRLRQLSGGLNLYYLSDRFALLYNVIWQDWRDAPDQLQHVLRFQLRI